VFVGSADWMPRNFFRRIEVVFPVEDGILRERLIHEVLRLNLEDTAKARLLKSDGSHERVALGKGATGLNCQVEFMRLAVAAAKETGDVASDDKRARKYPKVELAARPEA